MDSLVPLVSCVLFTAETESHFTKLRATPTMAQILEPSHAYANFKMGAFIERLLEIGALLHCPISDLIFEPIFLVKLFFLALIIQRLSVVPLGGKKLETLQLPPPVDWTD